MGLISNGEVVVKKPYDFVGDVLGSLGTQHADHPQCH